MDPCCHFFSAFSPRPVSPPTLPPITLATPSLIPCHDHFPARFVCFWSVPACVHQTNSPPQHSSRFVLCVVIYPISFFLFLPSVFLFLSLSLSPITLLARQKEKTIDTQRDLVTRPFPCHTTVKMSKGASRPLFAEGPCEGRRTLGTPCKG